MDDAYLDDAASRNPATNEPATNNPAADDAISDDVVVASRRGDDLVAVLVDRRRAAQASEVVLNPAQAAVIAEALRKVPAHVPATDLAVAEMELVIAARTLLPKDLRRLGRAILDRLDTDGPRPADHNPGPDADPAANPNVLDPTEAAHLAETLWWQPASVLNPVWASNPTGMPKRIRGLRFGGFITGENAELLQTLIDAAAKPRNTPSSELDPRTIGQRRADAFAIVLRAAAANGGEIPAHGGIKPHLSITLPYTALSSLGGLTPGTVAGSQTSIRSGPAASQLIGPGSQPTISQPTVGHFTIGSCSIADPQPGLGSSSSSGSLVFGDPLPASEVRRIACDAGIIPIVLGAQGEPLDVGREQRLVTPAIRRALIARDGGCVIPGCGAPPGHCEAHHLIHWSSGGITAVSNLALVCPTHHRAIHRGIWIVTIVEGQVRISRPTWTEPGPSG